MGREKRKVIEKGGGERRDDEFCSEHVELDT